MEKPKFDDKKILKLCILFEGLYLDYPQKKILFQIYYLLLLVFLIAIPFYLFSDRMLIGGDSLLPLFSKDIEKYIYTWIEVNGGGYYVVNIFSQLFIYKIIECFTNDIYYKGIVFFIFLRLILLFGSLRLLSLFTDECEKGIFKLLIIIFILFNPIFFNGWAYLQEYSFFPLFLYTVYRIIKNNKISYTDVVLLSTIFFFISTSLPNPKYIFYYFLTLLLILVFSILLKLINYLFFAANIKKIIFAGFTLSFIYIPLLCFVFQYNPNDNGVTVTKGYSKDLSIGMMDTGSTTADEMIRLFHDGLNLETKLKEKYLTNIFVVIANYFFIILILIYFILNKEKSAYDYINIILVLSLLFFAIGPNPPFGIFYEKIVKGTSLLAFLRTTAGAVFFLSIFYALLLYRSLIYFNSRILNLVFFLFTLFVSYPIINFDYYKNWSPVNTYIDGDKHGLTIPHEYLDLKSEIGRNLFDGKIFMPQSNLHYINTTWGYFGPGAFFHYLFPNKEVLGSSNILGSESINSIYFVLLDKSIEGEYTFNLDQYDKSYFTKNLTLYKVKEHKYNPPIFSSDKFSFVDEINPTYFKFLQNDNALFISKKEFRDINDLNLSVPKLLEYKKISSTKYRVVIHKAEKDFFLFFNQQFNSNWNISLIPFDPIINSKCIHEYKIFPSNEREQISGDELNSYLSNNLISTIGNCQKKEKENFQFNEANSESNREDYFIDFISKNYKGSIQNNNLDNGYFIETINKNRLAVKHFKANNFNGYYMDMDHIRKNYSDYIQTDINGSTFEVIIEFQPQLLYILSYLFSVFFFLVALILAIYENFPAMRSLLKKLRNSHSGN